MLEQRLTAAAADGDEDDLLADITACLGSLEVAAQLARTQSGMKPDKLPASIAAFRQSSAGGACSRSSSGRYSSGGKADVESGAVAATAGSSAVLRCSGSEAGAALTCAAAGTNSNSSSDGLGSDGSRPTGTQLVRGRSRLQTTTSNACLWDPQAEDVFDEELSEGPPAYTLASLQYAGASGIHGGLVLQKVGERSKAVPLADDSRAPSSPSRSSSNRSSAGSGSSSREGSVHDGQRSNFRHSLDAPATGYNTGVPSRRAASAAGAQPPIAVQPRPASTPRAPQVSAQEELECYQRALAVQQEQQQLQERRQHKQEQVVASYSCLSPHSPHRPTSHSSTRSDGGFSSSNNSSNNSSSNSGTGRSRPSSSKDTPSTAPAAGTAAAEASSRASTGGKWTVPASTYTAAACGGNTAAACCPGVGTPPSSLEDAWAVIQACTGVPEATVVVTPAAAPLPPRSRPTSASVRPTPVTAGSASDQGVHAPGAPGVLLGSGGSMLISKAAGSGQVVGLRVSAPGAGVLQAPYPPGCRPGSAGDSPSPRAKTSAAAAAAGAAASSAALRMVRQA